MKTFLHYTKEQELEEGIMDTIAGFAGSAVNKIATLGDYASAFRDNVAPAFAQGAKPGSLLKGITGSAQAFRNRSEVKQQEQEELDTVLVDLDEKIQDIDDEIAAKNRELSAATSNIKRISIQNTISKLNKEKARYQAKLDAHKKIKSKKQMQTQKRTGLATSAAAIRARP